MSNQVVDTLKADIQRANKALHPTAYSFAPSFVPHFVATLPAAGELGVSPSRDIW
jgi:hypothetical protein